MWEGSTNGAGYGTVWFRGRTTSAHRAVYIEHVGEIGDLELDHLCGVRGCVNPDHMEPVTHLENRRRGGDPHFAETSV
jgi:hypothetical protein